MVFPIAAIFAIVAGPGKQSVTRSGDDQWAWQKSVIA